MAVGSNLLLLEGQWWVRIDFWGPVDRGVVHGHGFESLNFGVNGGVVHGRGFESLTFWVNVSAVSAWSWVRIFHFGVNGGECMVKGSNLGIFGGQLWCNNHPQNQQSQPNPTQTIEATRLI
jgi:hypothetical protein